jgi:hypothetical protein
MCVASRRAALAFSLCGASIAVACLVPDVELVDRLPNGAAGATLGGSAAGKSSPPTGGDDSPGAESSGGAGQGGSSAAHGGTANGGSEPGAGTAGSSAGKDGSGGDGPLTWMFTGNGACGTDAQPLFCDDFEMERPMNWSATPLWERVTIADAPSGTQGLRSSFHEAPMGSSPATSGFNLSFWVRFGSLTDQAFITWSLSTGPALSFGLEGSSFRFLVAANPPVSAPELEKYTRGAIVDKWTCVEIVNVNATFQATVTVFGEDPVALSPIGGSADPGIDQMLLQAIPLQSIVIDSSIWRLADPGTDIELDDVRVVDAQGRSVCREFIEANQ